VALVCFWECVVLQWRLISGACLLLGGASVAVPASDWTERHRSRIAASLLSHPTHPGDVSFRGLRSSLGHLVEWGLPAVCAWCVRLSDPPCHVMIIIYHHHTSYMTERSQRLTTGGGRRRKATAATGSLALSELRHTP
jgi:hypothetical protein